jgi:HdeA/HdeB family
MTKHSRRAVSIAAVLLVGLGPGRASAQEAKNRSVEMYTCKDVMRENGVDRDVAIAFLHGFLIGKSGNPTFNLDDLHTQTNEFIDRCLDRPGDKAVDVMSKLKR